MFENIDETLGTHLCNTHVQHCNICNIPIHFCNIHLKHLQHTSETHETYAYNMSLQCNIALLHGQMELDAGAEVDGGAWSSQCASGVASTVWASTTYARPRAP
jgi:hypothetical protein